MNRWVLLGLTLTAILGCGKSELNSHSDLSPYEKRVELNSKDFDPVLNCVENPGFGCDKPPGACPNAPHCL